MAKFSLADAQVTPGEREAEIAAAADGVVPVKADKPPKNVGFAIHPELQMDLWTLKVVVGNSEEHAIVLNREVTDTHRSRFVQRTFVVAQTVEGLSYVFSVSALGTDSWSKSGRKMIAAAKEAPISYWTDQPAKKYRYAPVTRELGKLERPEWRFDSLEDYIEACYDEDLLITGLDHELVRNFEQEAPDSAVTDDP